jgi:hypothetical protein
MELDVTEAGLAGKGVGEENDGETVTGNSVEAGSGLAGWEYNAVAVGISVGTGSSLRIFKSEITTS